MQTATENPRQPGKQTAFEAFMASKCFKCAPYNARITPQSCALNRAKPEDARKPGCGDDCPDWLAQRDKKAAQPVQEGDRRGTCAFCCRINMTLPQAGLCGPCAQMSKRGEIVRVEGQENAWRETTAEERANPAPKPATAWDMVRTKMDCTQGDLSEKIGCSRSNVSLIFRKLDTGEAPTGKFYRKLLELTGYTTDELLKPWSDKRKAKRLGQYATGGNVEVPPYASDPDAAADVRGTDGARKGVFVMKIHIPAQEAESCQPLSQHQPDAAVLDAADTAPTLMGADPAEQLMDSEKLAELQQPAAIPADFVFFDDSHGTRQEAPQIRFDKIGDATINAAAVLTFGLDKVERVRLLYSARRGQFAMLPGYNGPGSRKLAVAKKGFPTRSINSRTAVRQFGLSVASRAFALALDPSGLLVATITNAPAQPGGEA